MHGGLLRARLPVQPVRISVTASSAIWKNSMQLVHTAAEPPNHGRISFAISGCTWNSRNALSRIVAAKSTAGTRARRAVYR